jgi:heme/copper-type cytochrome/quinol oxidase subunit 2
MVLSWRVKAEIRCHSLRDAAVNYTSVKVWRDNNNHHIILMCVCMCVCVYIYMCVFVCTYLCMYVLRSAQKRQLQIKPTYFVWTEITPAVFEV